MIHAGKAGVNVGRGLPTKINTASRMNAGSSMRFSVMVSCTVFECSGYPAKLIFEIQLTKSWKTFAD
jgi:hypothetical protein